MKLAVAVINLFFSLLIITGSLYWRIPALSALRNSLFSALLILSALVLVTSALVMFKTAKDRVITRNLASAPLLASLLALFLTLGAQINFQLVKARVMAAPAKPLETLGRHVIVGYRDPVLVKDLISKGAVGGVFITARNVKGKSVSEIKGVLDSFQAIHPHRDNVPIWKATDQEGGVVSRLSPPLPHQGPLSEVIENRGNFKAVRKAVEEYAGIQAKGLQKAGINLNLAPVVDLNHDIINPRDNYTKIYKRAISSDPAIVTKVARLYCKEMKRHGILCALKHFPGLGRVYKDTHKEPAVLESHIGELKKSDLAPFKRLMDNGAGLVMLSHVVWTTVDPNNPVSASSKVVEGLIRRQWNYNGLLITDNLTMNGFYAKTGDIGAGAVKSLNAGVDLLLISYDPDQYYYIMDALLKAFESGRLNRSKLESSSKRLTDALRGVTR
jgi:beta-N-acetylhexosaminidase